MTIITRCNYCINYQDILKAAKRTAHFLPPSPIVTHPYLNKLCHHNPKTALFFKLEALQQSGSFKIRGALNAILSLLETAPRENNSKEQRPLKVITHSSGNHGAALSLAAKLASSETSNKVEATVISPRNIPNAKKKLIENHGGNLILVKENCFEARIEKTKEIMNDTGAIFIHPFENDLVMAGQGTTALEMIFQIGADNSSGNGGSSITLDNQNYFSEEEIRRHVKYVGNTAMDTVIIPVGGGALAASCSIILRYAFGDRIKIILAEPENYDDTKRSFNSGKLLGHNLPLPPTLCDGLKAELGPSSWPIIHDLVDDVITVSESDILQSAHLIWNHTGIAVEYNASIALAVAIGEEFGIKFGKESKNVGLILCGGNTDDFTTPVTDATGRCV